MVTTAEGFTRAQLRQLSRMAERQQERLRGGRFWRQLDFLISLALLVVLAFGVRAFVAEPVRVDGDSMYPTLQHGEHMFVEKVSYWFRAPARSSVIIRAIPRAASSA